MRSAANVSQQVRRYRARTQPKLAPRLRKYISGVKICSLTPNLPTPQALDVRISSDRCEPDFLANTSTDFLQLRRPPALVAKTETCEWKLISAS
jgi:hypothetical protein